MSKVDEKILSRAAVRARDYGRRREWEHIRTTRADAEIINGRLRDMYTRLADTIKAETTVWYMKNSGKEGITYADAGRLASAGDIKILRRDFYNMLKKREGKRFLIDLTEKQQLALHGIPSRISRYELLLRQLTMISIGVVDETTMMIGDHLYGVSISELIRQADILGETLRDLDTLKRVAERIVNTSMYGQTFSQRIWNNNVKLIESLAEGIQRSMVLGKNPLEWHMTLSDIVSTHVRNVEYACRRIAITEVGRVQIEAQKDSYLHYGYEQYQVICEPTACHICLPHDGEIYSVENMIQGENAPMFHPNCQCRTTAFMNRQEVDDVLDLYEKLVELYSA